MSEPATPELGQPTNLHDIPALRMVRVRDDIVLRPLNVYDADSMLGILDADPTIRERVSVAAKMRTPVNVEEQVETSLKDGDLIRYAIVESDTTIGLVSFWRDIDNPFDAPDNPDDYGFGFFLDPSKRGKGIVTDAVEKIMDLAVQSLEVRQFIAYCEDDNPDSIAVLSKLGFQPTDITLTEQSSGWVERKYVREVP